eukprot:RCo017381
MLVVKAISPNSQAPFEHRFCSLEVSFVFQSHCKVAQTCHHGGVLIREVQPPRVQGFLLQPLRFLKFALDQMEAGTVVQRGCHAGMLRTEVFPLYCQGLFKKLVGVIVPTQILTEQSKIVQTRGEERVITSE